MKLGCDNSGFILLEILVSLVILTVGIFFLIQSLSFIITSNDYVRCVQIAPNIADNVLNRLSSGEIFLLHGEETFFEKKFVWDCHTFDIADGAEGVSVTVSWEGRKKTFQKVFTCMMLNQKN
ncbi:MAG: hypothetical protein HY810_04485 [Candidatus Omnitrophica bacterium]|nr:hypothetical protein [Candidatus Omnitrophota bacterium]